MRRVGRQCTEEAVPLQGPLDGPAGIPSAALQRQFPGLGAAWGPAHRQQLLEALGQLEKARVATTIGRLLCRDHPVVRGSGDAVAYGLFAGEGGIQRGELVGWYGGELVLESEVRLDGSYAASFVVVDELEVPLQVTAGGSGDRVRGDDAAQKGAGQQRVLRIDASRLRSRMAFINDYHHDALGHDPAAAPPACWPSGPNVELRQVALRLHPPRQRMPRCQCGGRPSDSEGGGGGTAVPWWPVMGVHALADIPPHSELFLDYSNEYWGRMRELSEARLTQRFETSVGRRVGDGGLEKLDGGGWHACGLAERTVASQPEKYFGYAERVAEPGSGESGGVYLCMRTHEDDICDDGAWTLRKMVGS